MPAGTAELPDRILRTKDEAEGRQPTSSEMRTDSDLRGDSGKQPNRIEATILRPDR